VDIISLRQNVSVKFLLLLFFLSFFFYNLNLRTINSGDTFPASVIPVTILTNGNLYLDEFNDYCEKNKIDHYFLHKKDSHYISSYPIATGLIALPFYIVPVFLFKQSNHLIKKNITSLEWIRFSLIIEKFSASIITSLSVVIFFLISLMLTNEKTTLSLIVSFIYAFCSSAFSISSQALWQHTTGIFFMLFSTLLLINIHNIINAKNQINDYKINTMIVMLGFFCSLCLAIRPLNILFVLPVSVYFLFRFPIKKTIILALSAIPVSIALIYYNIYYFSSVTGGYPINFSTKFIQGFSGLLFSPGRGLIFYFPFTIIGFIGLLFIIKNKISYKGVYYIFFAFSMLQILIVSKWFSWWGGHCYGPRLLSEIQPFLILLAIPIMMKIISDIKIFTKILIFLLIAWSFYAQIVGTFFHPAGQWDSTPSNVNIAPERLWDLNDNPIKRNSLSFIKFLGKI